MRRVRERDRHRVTKQKRRKKLAILCLAVLLCAGCVAGIVYYQNQNQKKIAVYPMEMLNSAEWWESDSEITGTLTSDYVQEVKVTPNKAVKKIFVKEGDKVKAGDRLLKYDMEEEEVNLKLQELQIESSKMEIKTMEQELAELKSRRARASVGGHASVQLASLSMPLSVDLTKVTYLAAETESGTEAGTEDSTATLPDSPKSSISSLSDRTSASGNGKSEKNPYIFHVLKDGSGISGKVINELIKKGMYASFREYNSVEEYQKAPGKPVNQVLITPSTLFGETISEKAKYEISSVKELIVSISKVEITPKTSKVQTGKGYEFNVKVSGANTGNLKGTWTIKGNKSPDTLMSEGYLWIAEGETAKKITVKVVVQGKSASRTLTVEKGSSSDDDYDVEEIDDGGDYIDDGEDSEDGEGSDPEDLNLLIQEKETEILEAKRALNEANIAYKEAKKEVEAGTVKATFSGTVTFSCTKDTIPADETPAIVVRAESGMYVKTQVSEMDLGSVKVGGTIHCTSWESENKFEAKIREISEFPVESEQSGMGNPNTSYYPVVAYIAEGDGLSLGGNVTVSYSAQSMGEDAENAIFLHKAYIRSDSGGSYVWKAGENSRLEKQYIQTGKTLNGQYVEILSGITLEDCIAFPYGKKVKEGAKTEISEDTEKIIY